LVVVQCTQPLPERPRHFLGGDLLEGAAQVRKAWADGACRQLAAQPRQALVDRGAHRRQAPQLGEAPPPRPGRPGWAGRRPCAASMRSFMPTRATPARCAAAGSTLGGTPKSMIRGA